MSHALLARTFTTRHAAKLSSLFPAGHASILRCDEHRRPGARPCQAPQIEASGVARLKVTASQLGGRETKESRQQCTQAYPVACSRASVGDAPSDPRGTCQQGATQRDLHPTTSGNRRQALCVWLRADSRPIRQRFTQTAGERETETIIGGRSARRPWSVGHDGSCQGRAKTPGS